MNLNLYIICTATLFCLIDPAVADNIATIHGAVYITDTFEPLDNAVIEVNSTPTQCMVAKQGQYSIKLMPGNYSIKAKYYEDNKLIYAVTGTISIEAGGDYVYDLLLPQVNYENLNESSKEPIINTPIEKIENSNGVSFTSLSSKSVAETQKTADAPVSSNSINNLQTPATIQSRLYSSIDYLLIGFAFCFLLIVSFLLRNYRKIENNYPKKGNNKPIIRNSFESINTLKTLGKVSAKDIGSEVKPEFKVKNGEAVSVTEVEFKTQESNTPGSENYPAWKTELAESVSEEDKIRISLDEIASNLGIETYTLKKKLLLHADFQKVVDVIQSQGGMIAQKELRSKLNYSEVKVSIMLTDLEKMKRIKKLKRGRENFVILTNWKH